MTTITAYKVVLRKADELTSLDPPCESLRVVYPVRDWAMAPVGGLLCFDTAFSAYAAYRRPLYLCAPGSIEIWEAWGKDPVELPRLRLDVLPIGEEDSTEKYVRRLWSGRLDDHIKRFTAWWPNGSLGFRSVNLRYPVVTQACLNDRRELDGRAYELALGAVRETVSDPWRQEIMFSPLGFKTYESFRLAYDGRGPITVGQAYRVVSYGIELSMAKIVEPLFYALLGFRSKGETTA